MSRGGCSRAGIEAAGPALRAGSAYQENKREGTSRTFARDRQLRFWSRTLIKYCRNRPSPGDSLGLSGSTCIQGPILLNPTSVRHRDRKPNVAQPHERTGCIGRRRDRQQCYRALESHWRIAAGHKEAGRSN
eukprot:gene21639-biopygen7491